MAELDKADLLAILRVISNMLRFVGLALVVPVLVSVFYSEVLYANVFAVMAIVLTVVFSLIHFIVGKREVEFKHAMISVALCWFIVGFISCIPFLFAGIPFVDAFFESISGWSGSGLSMVKQPETLPFSLNFWRGFIQWIGGFGIVILALIFYERPETAHKLFQAEGRTESFYINVIRIARIIIAIYLVYTAIGVVLLLAAGLSPFDALIHAFSSIATGGFSTTSAGMGNFGKMAMSATILLMLLGGISFESHRDLLKGRIKRFFSNPEVKLLFGLILAASAIIFLNNYLSQNSHFFNEFFYVVSAISGTGATGEIAVSALPAISIFVLIRLMVFGACYGSTTGAIKLWRILIVFKVVRREIYRALLPKKTIIPIKVGGKPVSSDAALDALAYIGLYILLLAFGSIVFMFGGYGVIESVFTVASAQGNVGLSVIAGNAWFGMNDALKILLSIHMIAGRMEIIPFLVVLKSFGIVRKI